MVPSIRDTTFNLKEETWDSSHSCSSLSLFYSFSLSLSLWPFLSSFASLPLSLSLSLSPSLFPYRPLSFPIALSHSLSPSLSTYLTWSFSPALGCLGKMTVCPSLFPSDCSSPMPGSGVIISLPWRRLTLLERTRGLRLVNVISHTAGFAGDRTGGQSD